MIANNIKALLFDMDGVLLRANTVIPGVPQLLARLKAAGYPFIIASNNSTMSRQMYQEKLANLGINVDVNQLHTAPAAVTQYLVSNGYHTVFCIGSPGFKQELAARGIVVLEEYTSTIKVDCIVLGGDRSITYQKFDDALRYYQTGAKMIAANSDPTFPTPERLMPGAGLVIGAMESITKDKVEIIGKPNPLFFHQALKKMAFPAEQVLMIGDTIDVDILPAQALGLLTALVLSGNTQKAPTPQISHWVLPDVTHLEKILSIS